MKLGSRTLGTPNIEVLVLPRGDGDIVFKAQAVLNMKDFEKLYPAPEPPTKMYPGGRKAEEVNDPDYIKSMEEYSETRFHYMALQSLKATEELEWETVDESDPSTWKNYVDELGEAGFTEVEVNRVIQIVLDANCLNEDRIDEARRRFLLQQQEALEKSMTPAAEQNSTPSGGSVSV
jgi:hypothetical protein